MMYLLLQMFMLQCKMTISRSISTWKEIPIARYQSLIDALPRVMDKIIKKSGKQTRYVPKVNTLFRMFL